MISFFSLFWIFFALFAVIGATRGRTKEFIVSLSAIVGIFLNLLLETYVPFYRDLMLTAYPTTLFMMRSGILLAVVIMGYVTPSLPQVILRAQEVRPVGKVRNLFWGTALGALNGYLIVGSILFYLNSAGYPFPFMLRTRSLAPRWGDDSQYDRQTSTSRSHPSRDLFCPGDCLRDRDRSLYLMTHYHFIGIGGTGLSAIARVLLEKGNTVSGSDQNLSPQAQELKSLGVKVSTGHDPLNVTGADIIIRSSAVKDDNPEVIAARNAGIPVLKRFQMLSGLTRGQEVIAVAGTHGKTTTTAMAAWALTKLGLDPSFVLGSELRDLNLNGHYGKGRYFVIEADEYDNMFLGLDPRFAIVTYMEHDHPDCFPTLEDYRTAFRKLHPPLPEGWDPAPQPGRSGSIQSPRGSSCSRSEFTPLGFTLNRITVSVTPKSIQWAGIPFR